MVFKADLFTDLRNKETCDFASTANDSASNFPVGDGIDLQRRRIYLTRPHIRETHHIAFVILVTPRRPAMERE